MKFSKGDRIRSIGRFWNGKNGVVTAVVPENASLPVEVLLEDGSSWNFAEYELEAVLSGLDVMLELVPL